MIIVPILAAITWIIQAFFDKELLKHVSIETLMFIKLGLVFLFVFIVSNLYNSQTLSNVFQELKKITKRKDLIRNVIIVCFMSSASIYVHYLGYKNFKISKFVSLETIFSIVLSVFVGYMFFQERLDKYECLGVLVGVIAIMIFYYKDLKRILNI